MSNMRQVSKEQYEMLTIFHPGEVRYYVDIGIVTHRKRGASARNGKPTTKHVSGHAGTSVVKHGGSHKRGQYVQLGVAGAGNMRPETVQYKVYCAATRILAEDPTKVMLRPNLTSALVMDLPDMDKVQQIVPAITTLIQTNRLRYKAAS